MAENLLVRECSAGVSEDVASYWGQKRPQIERLLKRFRENQGAIRLNVGCGEIGYTARVVVTLPTRTLIARTNRPVGEHRAAIDEAVNRMIATIHRHAADLRQDQAEFRRRRSRRDFASTEPHLASLRDENDTQGFFEVLRPLLRNLRSHARRELILAQLEGNVGRNELTADDVLDEVIVRAWDGWNGRPRNQPLERWLIRLLHEILDARGFNPTDEPGKRPAAEPKELESIWERVREDQPRFEAEDTAAIEENPDWPYVGENEWITDNNPYWTYLDPLLREAELPAEGSVEPWHELAAKEEWDLVLNELNNFPREQRRAFTLHAFEGWSIKDVAEAQHRPVDKVRADIEAVRSALRERLKEAMS